MNDWVYFERNDTGILSLADLFRQDRLPCLAEPKRWLAAGGNRQCGGFPAPGGPGRADPGGFHETGPGE